jgi:hypothetical protein
MLCHKADVRFSSKRHHGKKHFTASSLKNTDLSIARMTLCNNLTNFPPDSYLICHPSNVRIYSVTVFVFFIDRLFPFGIERLLSEI